MRPLVKICGITRLDDALWAAEAGADALGFIFYEGSPRYLTPNDAAQIIGQLPAGVQKVGVFVNRHRSVIERAIEEIGIGVLQLHGDERPEECQPFSVKVWKGVRVRFESEIARLRDYDVDAFVFDAHLPGHYGGTGNTSNWTLARAAARQHRIVLSGGLNPENIQQAIEFVQPWGVDVNSGVESAPGKKDPEKLKRLFEALRRLRAEDSTAE